MAAKLGIRKREEKKVLLFFSGRVWQGCVDCQPAYLQDSSIFLQQPYNQLQHIQLLLEEDDDDDGN